MFSIKESRMNNYQGNNDALWDFDDVNSYLSLAVEGVLAASGTGVK